MRIDPNSNSEYKAVEYADWHCWKSVITPYTEQGWTTTPTADFSTPTMDFLDYDATISKNNELRYIVEIKSRGDNIKPTTYDEFIIDSSKVEKLKKAMEEKGVDAYIFELFPNHGVGYIWHISPLNSEFREVYINANENTIAGNSKVRKKMCMLPHSNATAVNFNTDLWSTMHEKAVKYYAKN